ncbi:MAG: ferrous iron transport protein B, partial [Phycisphaerae bacterium]
MQSPSATEAAAATVHVALVGNPNTGKSTLFNTLTGYHQRVGNFPGVTVELKIGEVRGSATDSSMQLVDLPGSYSLHAESADEAILLDVLIGDRSGLPKPDALLCVIDACHLRRNLFLVTQVIELGLPVVVALNMTDIAASRGVSIDVDVLRDRLGVPVVPIVATRDSSVRPLLDALQQVVANGQVPADRPLLPQDVRNCGAQLAAGLAGDAALKDELGEQAKQGPVPGGPRAAALEITQALLAPKGFMEQRLITKHGPSILDRLSEQREVLERAHGAVVEIEAQSRYAWIDEVVQSSVQDGASRGRSRSDLADKWLTHRVWGLLVFLVLMAICFQAVYSWSGPFMDFIDGCFAWVGGSLASMVPEGALQSLLTDGVVAGVGGVLIFLPQILILFLFIAILEDCGYMARVAFLLDRWMGWVGLSGRSFVPLISSFACAIPGILATRTIEDRRSRYATMLIAPLMSCSARLPVYVLLISTFVPAQSYLGGWLGLQALVMLALYAVGVVAAIFVAWILNRTMLKGRAPSFLMELPSYKWPSVRTVFFRLYEQGREFCISAGTIIFATTIIIWALGY